MSNQVTYDSAELDIKLKRSGPKVVEAAIIILAVGLSLFQLYTAGIDPLGLFFQRGVHLAVVLMLTFLLFPPFKKSPRNSFMWLVDLLLFLAAAYSGFYLVYNLDAIFDRAGFWTQQDVWVGVMTTLVLLEASRRAVGLGLTIIGVVAILYAFAGSRGELPWLGEWLPGILNHRGYTLDRVAAQMYLGQ